MTDPNAPANTYGSWWNTAAQSLQQAVETTIGPITEADYRARGQWGDENSPGAAQLIGRFGLTPASRVLEIGCGIARIGREMAPEVAEWHGADISSGMLDLARSRCAGIPNIVFHHLPETNPLGVLASESYDLVYMTVVLMHLDKEDVFHYLNECFRLVRPGGSAYFDTWNLLHPDTFRIWRESSRLGNDKVRGRMQCSTPPELEKYLREAGFEIEALDTEGRLVRAWCRKPVEVAARLVDDDGWAPFGYLGPPDNMATVSGQLLTEGWVLDHVVRVDIVIDGKVAGEAELGGYYPGLENHFPQYPGAKAARYTYLLDTTGLTPGPHTIAAVAVDNEGRQTTLTGENRAFIVGGVRD